MGPTLNERSLITDANFPISLAPLYIAIETQFIAAAHPFTHEDNAVHMTLLISSQCHARLTDRNSKRGLECLHSLCLHRETS
jgi:hypothetical protein